MSPTITVDNEEIAPTPFVRALLELAGRSIPEDYIPREHMDDEDLHGDDVEQEIFVSLGAIRAARAALASMGYDKDGKVLPEPQSAHVEASMSEQYITVVMRLPADAAQRKIIIKSFNLFHPGGYLGATTTAMDSRDSITALEKLEAK